MRHHISIVTLAAALAAFALGAGTGFLPAQAAPAGGNGNGNGGGNGGGNGHGPGAPHGRDTTAPTLVAPADITTDAIAPMGRSLWFTASVTDDKDPAPTVTFSPPSGSTFPVGTTTVTVTATDWKGNTTTDTFDVTVQAMSGPVAFREYWLDGDGYEWFVWDITVSPDGTVSGVGLQTNLILVYQASWGPYGYAYPLPAGLSGSGVVSGTMAADGACQFTSSRNYWYQDAYEYDADGNPVYREDAGGFSGSMTASLWGNGISFSGSPLDAPETLDFWGYANWWILQ